MQLNLLVKLLSLVSESVECSKRDKQAVVKRHVVLVGKRIVCDDHA